MHYARMHWSYIASAKAGGEALLAGSATQAPCGGIATALRILIEEKLGLPVEYITIPGYVWTKPSCRCFDAKVHGNVSLAKTPDQYNEGCVFNEHYFIKCGLRYYDPCLNSIYVNRDQPIRKLFRDQDMISKGVIMAGEDDSSMLVFRPHAVVAGWQRGAWMIVRSKDLLNYVKDKNDLMLISTRLKTGDLAMTARKESRKLFADAKRLDYWKSEHALKGIVVN